MQIGFVLLQQALVMAALMALGFALFRCGIISEATSKDLGKLLLNAVFPVVILQSFWRPYSPEQAQTLALTFVLSLACLAVAIVIARVMFPRDGVSEFAAAFSNAGFVGIPLVRAALGADAVFFISCFIAQLNVLQWTYGKFRISGSAESIQPRAIVTSPMLIGFAAGVALFLLRVPTPQLATTIMDSIAGLNSPLAMIILGVYLAQSDARSLFGTGRLYLVALARLVLIPAATAVLLALVPCAVEVKLALLIAASAPTGSNVAIFCHQLGGDVRLACNAVCLTTLLSLATMPVAVTLASSVL